MYAALWRVLPGPIVLKIVILVVLAAAILFALATWVFPWVADLLTPSQEVTVDH